MSVKGFLREKGMQVGTAVMLAAPAAEATGSSSVVKIISDAASGLKTDALTVIAAGVGIGVVFWGAKVLWSKFKGMAK
jgi:hypothetical protein